MHTGPKTSRAARDRPEPNPRRNQTSRHDITGDSPKRRRSGGRPATATRKKSRATQGVHGRNIARASVVQRRPGGASRRWQRAASSATHARPRETKPERRRPSSAIARSRRAEWSGAKVRNKNARGGHKCSPKAAQGSALPAAVLRNGSRLSTLQAAQRARSWREHRTAARAQSRAVEGSPRAAAADGLDSINFDFRSEKLRIRYNNGNSYDQIRKTLALIPLLWIRIRPPARQRKNIRKGRETINTKNNNYS
ncbi:origin recognition complex subunit 1-like [Dorcoceras hygrometricum]|uniref:Origin recognition complex subunit 1-like n=1 Tax=Dorcoceras hygrometricum TaxID=472368 RepID=A0A2Z6ZVX6_9LAMI|nr:origin recognition complex subunit 1-like [Dorcoceras hygrometricum]